MKTGFISLIGRPNAGKSTLLNHILQEKVAITSRKPQTTRSRITGILNRSDAQVVFVDTPGIHKPKHRLGTHMVQAARESIYDGDLIYYVVDASVLFGPGEEYILNILEQVQAPIFLLLNKTDTMSKEEILKTILAWQARGDFAEVFPLSALKGDNVPELVATTLGYLEDGPQFYPEDMVTDQPEKVVAAELVREKILRLTEEEVPHGVAVVIEKMSRREDDDKLVINALVYVERQSQKRILIGKGGQMMKKIGIQARRDIERLFGEEVYLEIWVKVKENWRDREALLQDLGLSQTE